MCKFSPSIYVYADTHLIALTYDTCRYSFPVIPLHSFRTPGSIGIRASRAPRQMQISFSPRISVLNGVLSFSPHHSLIHVSRSFVRFSSANHYHTTHSTTLSYTLWLFLSLWLIRYIVPMDTTGKGVPSLPPPFWTARDIGDKWQDKKISYVRTPSLRRILMRLMSHEKSYN